MVKMARRRNEIPYDRKWGEEEKAIFSGEKREKA